MTHPASRMLPSALLLLAGLAFSAWAGAATLSVLVLDKEGKPTPDAVVVVVPSAMTGAAPSPLPSQVTIYQEKMRFVPAVSVVGLGAKAQFVNNDPWEHHVRASPAAALNCAWTASQKASRPERPMPLSPRPAPCCWAATSTAPCAATCT
jgi:plastocyanin